MKKDIYAVLLVVAMLLALVIVANAEENNPGNPNSPFTYQLNKPVICGNIQEVKKHYENDGFTPTIRANSEINFKTLIYLKESKPGSGKITEIVIIEINPGDTIACVAYAGKKVEFNTNFWDEFLSTTIYYDPEKGLGI